MRPFLRLARLQTAVSRNLQIRRTHATQGAIARDLTEQVFPLGTYYDAILDGAKAREAKAQLVKESKPEPVQEKKPEPVTEKKPEPVAEKKPEPVREEKPKPVQEEKPKPAQEEKAKSETEEKPKKEREEKDKKDREEKPKHEREEKSKKERDDKPKKDREEKHKHDREDKHKKDRDDKPKHDRDEKSKDSKPPRSKKGSSKPGTTTEPSTSTPTTVTTTTTTTETSATAQEKARIIFGSSLAGPAERADRLQAIRDRSTVIAGIRVPPRPEEPDNCCMSGCVNCVWDRYRDDMEEWAAASALAKKAQEAERARELGEHADKDVPVSSSAPPSSVGTSSMDDDGGGSETNWETKTDRGDGSSKEFFDDDLYNNVPVGIREFMKHEKKLKEKHKKEGTFGG